MNTDTDTAAIVVASDFSVDAIAAAVYGAWLAARTGRGLRIVHVLDLPTPAGRTILPPTLLRTRLRRARAGLRATAAITARSQPAITVRTKVRAGRTVSALVRSVGPDDLLVIGARGLGGYPALRWGSVSNGVSAQAPCPVFVVRDSGGSAPAVNARGPVVVLGEALDAAADDLATAVAAGRPRIIGGAAGSSCMLTDATMLAGDPVTTNAADALVVAADGASLIAIARSRGRRFAASSLMSAVISRTDTPVVVLDAPAPHTAAAARAAILEGVAR
jgi:nucleotide-binding universal stress UspA family protein